MPFAVADDEIGLERLGLLQNTRKISIVADDDIGPGILSTARTRSANFSLAAPVATNTGGTPISSRNDAIDTTKSSSPYKIARLPEQYL